METQGVNIVFNITGNANTAVKELNTNFVKSVNIFNNIEGKLIAFKHLTDILKGFKDTLDGAIQPGIAFDSQLRELSAITGVVGDGLNEIGRNAREAAISFGVDAGGAVRSYSLLLSQLSPEIAKQPAALKAMGDAVSRLSKSMGNDAAAAAETLTTAMNQFGVSLDDPMRASEVMADMMNVMAAAAAAGSAELPQIKQALEQSGMAAKAAGVSFEETNAAIQVLDKAGRKGSEGGVALRNVMTTLSKGRFLPKQVLEELREAGINTSVLTDKSKTLGARLEKLKPILDDDAMLTKLFGKENASSARALIEGTEQMKTYTEAVSGTNAAFEYADTVMESYEERQARIKAQFDDLKISIFNATGDLGIWTNVIIGTLIPVSQLVPLIIALKNALMFVGVYAKSAYTHLGMYNGYLALGQVANLGFRKNVIQAAVALGRFATVGLFNAVKGVGALILSLITGSSASVAFSAISSGAFGAFAASAKVACRAVTVAIGSIPIIGWIAIAVTAIGALFVWLYNKFDRFRAFLNGIGAAIKAVFTKEGVNDAFNRAYKETMDEAKKKAEEESKDDPLKQVEEQQKALEDMLKDTGAETGAGGVINANTNSVDSGSSAAGENKIKNININIDKVIEQFTVQTTTVRESTERIKQLVRDAIVEGINDVNLAF
jgi:TP901 family phage tail tape measure protein